jgi:hypothetical protein
LDLSGLVKNAGQIDALPTSVSVELIAEFAVSPDFVQFKQIAEGIF